MECMFRKFFSRKFLGFNRLPRTLYSLVLLIAVSLLATTVRAEEEANQTVDKSLLGLKLGVLAYVDYSEGEMPLPNGKEMYYNRFGLTRGYFTVKKSMTDWMGMRLTMDVKQESKASGAKLNGSYVVRMKYFYAELKPEDFGFFTNMKSEIGLGHIPWLDFEEHINPYRSQGTMAIETAHVFNSADLGVSLRGYFGGKLEGAEEKTGSHYYDGRLGSWHIGIYNGGGYHEVENNQNKLAEGRVTIRPLPGLIPGLQLSYLGIFGEGNQAKAAVVGSITLKNIPDYQVNNYMLSFEHPMVVITGQYYTTEGNQSGTWIEPDGDALDTEGWSVFGNFKIPGTNGKANIFGRYDWFDQDPDDEWAKDTEYAMTVAGLAFDLYKHNLLLLVWENTDYEDDANTKGKLPKVGNDLGKEEKIQVVWQIKF